jgi:hypothetical protein
MTLVERYGRSSNVGSSPADGATTSPMIVA